MRAVWRLDVEPRIFRWWLACCGCSGGRMKSARARRLVVVADAGKGGGVVASMAKLLAADLASASASSLPVIPAWPGIQFRWKWVHNN